jgi:hypothetical protein
MPGKHNPTMGGKSGAAIDTRCERRRNLSYAPRYFLTKLMCFSLFPAFWSLSSVGFVKIEAKTEKNAKT